MDGVRPAFFFFFLHMAGPLSVLQSQHTSLKFTSPKQLQWILHATETQNRNQKELMVINNIQIQNKANRVPGKGQIYWKHAKRLFRRPPIVLNGWTCKIISRRTSTTFRFGASRRTGDKARLMDLYRDLWAGLERAKRSIKVRIFI